MEPAMIEKLVALRELLGDREFKSIAGGEAFKQVATYKERGVPLSAEKLAELENLIGKRGAREILTLAQTTQDRAEMTGVAYKERERPASPLDHFFEWLAGQQATAQKEQQQPATGIDAVVTWWMESHQQVQEKSKIEIKRRLQEADAALKLAIESGDRVAIARAAHEWLNRHRVTPIERKTFLDFITGK